MFQTIAQRINPDATGHQRGMLNPSAPFPIERLLLRIFRRLRMSSRLRSRLRNRLQLFPTACAAVSNRLRSSVQADGARRHMHLGAPWHLGVPRQLGALGIKQIGAYLNI